MTMNEAKPAIAAVNELFSKSLDGLRDIVRAVMQEMLEAEMTDALGAEKSERTMPYASLVAAARNAQRHHSRILLLARAGCAIGLCHGRPRSLTRQRHCLIARAYLGERDADFIRLSPDDTAMSNRRASTDQIKCIRNPDGTCDFQTSASRRSVTERTINCRRSAVEDNVRSLKNPLMRGLSSIFDRGSGFAKAACAP